MLDGETLLRDDPAARARYAPLFDLGARLLRFGLAMPPAGTVEYRGASPEIVTGAVLALFTMATKTFRAVQHLGSNVLSEPALMLLRSLSECWASLGFIVADPASRAERADWYLIGEEFENYRSAKKFRETDLTELVPPEQLQDLDAVYEDVRKRLIQREVTERGESGAEESAQTMLGSMHKGWWGGVKPEEMYEIAERWASGGDEEVVTYATAFKFASGVLHGRKPDMFMKQRDDGTFEPNLRADPTYLGYALYTSNALYISILAMIIEVFGLRWKSAIQDFFRDLRAAGKIAKAEDAT